MIKENNHRTVQLMQWTLTTQTTFKWMWRVYSVMTG